MEAAEEERSLESRRGKGGMGLRRDAEAARLRQRIYRAIRYLAAPGLWGSLVDPSGFGTPRRGRRACDGSSNLPSPIINLRS